jgi:hypothetical protein
MLATIFETMPARALIFFLELIILTAREALQASGESRARLRASGGLHDQKLENISKLNLASESVSIRPIPEGSS